MKQEYQINNMFPIKCWSFNSPKGMVEDTLEKVKEIDYRNYNAEFGVGTSDDMAKMSQFYDLHQWFQRCIDTLHVDNGWHCDRIVINKSWANRSDAQSGHHHAPHRHPMSYLSGIYYLTEGPATIFVDPLHVREWAQLHLDGGPVAEKTQYIFPKPGGLFVFPSYLIHSSAPNESEINRYSIALNTFPQGEINAGAWDRSMLTVGKVDGWDDLGSLPLHEYTKDKINFRDHE